MISIIIPTYNEADQIQNTLSAIAKANQGQQIEVIVADGGSTDNTVQIARSCGATAVVSDRKGRAAQMNRGAVEARGEVLYFLHADSIPPKGFTEQILKAHASGYKSGCFQLAFDHPHWFLKANCWFTRFDVDAFRYGDQSLFVHRDLFKEVGGFCEKHIVFEDYNIVKQLKKRSRFLIMKGKVTTSARKYLDNGIFKMQGIFFLMYFLYKFGSSQEHLVSTYKKLIRQNKI
ncbi:TIGR04283 family arsenosugar biosynthesis glycosyltransferase [Flavisolibacter sp. BT320]|nr:TIGR04283 family arsenosugar biosynthesis glycosyltransferase [Flavisolibacter longurius]